MLRRGFDALARRRFDEAGACCRAVLQADPRALEAHFLVGLIAVETQDWRTACSAFGTVSKINPQHAAAQAQLARGLMMSGYAIKAEESLKKAVQQGSRDPLVMDIIGIVFSLLGDQVEALNYFNASVAKRPNVPSYNMNKASCLVFHGRGDDAEKVLRHVLEIQPRHAQAHWMLARLKRAVTDEHTLDMEKMLTSMAGDAQAVAFLAYGLGKEYEDLEEWERAFEAYERGARARRSRVKYDEAREIKMFAALEKIYTERWLESVSPGCATAAPIFIIGQPRTGTTLIERIVTSHSQVHSAGELQQFGLAVGRLSEVQGKERLSAEVMQAAARIPPEKLGETYLRTTANLRGEAPRFVDKLPVNYLYVPLILAALPNARILHLVRDPMDSCFASYKQLFAEAYYHSYDQEEMARHHVRYRHLMAWWRARFPDAFLDVVYEDVVSDLEPHARRIIDYLDLPWEAACLDFHAQEGTVTTASATQVREKAHTRSVRRWKKFEAKLQPMHRVLKSAGLAD